MPKFNLGRKPEKTEVQPADVSKEIYYPSIKVSSEEVEGLELKMGEKVSLIGIVTGVEKNEQEGGKKSSRYNIDIKQLNKGYSEEEYLSKSEDDKDKIDEEGLGE